MNTYQITFTRNLHRPIIVDAESIDDAKRIGIAEYRKRCTMIDFFKIDFVIDKVTEITKS